MRRTLRICRNAWTKFGNCPGGPSPVLPLSDDGGENWDCRFSTLQGSAVSAFSCEAGATAFGNRTRSQSRPRGCSRGLGCYPNKQKLRLPATPGTAVFRLCGNKDTACKVAHPYIPLFPLLLFDKTRNLVALAKISMCSQNFSRFSHAPVLYYNLVLFGL